MRWKRLPSKGFPGTELPADFGNRLTCNTFPNMGARRVDFPPSPSACNGLVTAFPYCSWPLGDETARCRYFQRISCHCQPWIHSQTPSKRPLHRKFNRMIALQEPSLVPMQKDFAAFIYWVVSFSALDTKASPYLRKSGIEIPESWWVKQSQRLALSSLSSA